MSFKAQLLQGIPDQLPPKYTYDASLNHAPKRKAILGPKEKRLALQNALRYFDTRHHQLLLKEFIEELD